MRKFTTFAIILCICLVFFNLGAHAIFNPERVAEEKIEELAKDYYENYYYDIFVSGLPEEDYATAFLTYHDYGFQRIYLRELLLFDNGRHADYRGYFDGQYFCNTNHTSIQIFPYPPYGKTDYEVKYTYDCWWNAS